MTHDAPTPSPEPGRTPQERVLEMADLLRPSAIRAAATLRVADHLAATASTADDLARRIDARADVLEKLLRYLATIGLLQRRGDEYALTALGQVLRGDREDGVQPFLSSEGAVGHGDLALVNLVHTVRTGAPPHRSLFGTDYWQHVQQDPTYRESLESLGSSPFDLGSSLLDDYDWGAVDHVTDVGGNDGSLLIALLTRHPHLHGTVVDLENSVDIARRRIAAAGLDTRCEALVRDFFEQVPAGADVYLLSGILGDWSDDEAVAILERCGRAAGDNGRVLVADASLPSLAGEQPDDPVVAWSDLYFAALMPRPDRTDDERIAIASKAGLALSWRGPANELRSLLEFTVAST